MRLPLRIAVIGSGWRSLYYVRIAEALPQHFRICMMLCRSEEKAQYMAKTYHIPTGITEEAVRAAEPDVVVIAAKKESNPVLSMHWLKQGYTVLQETPAAMDDETLEKLLNTSGKLVIAEQYRRYPEYIALKKLMDTGILGDPDDLYCSLAHEYHAASLIRYFLNIPAGTPFEVKGSAWLLPTAETLTRYEQVKDGRVREKMHAAALFSFAGNKAALYDFDSEQYRSPIRSSHIRIRGSRGEIDDHTVRYLDENNEPCSDLIQVKYRTIETEDLNPNLRVIKEITEIRFREQILYQPSFGVCGLGQDETALAALLYETGLYASGEADSPYPLCEAIDDARTAIRMKQAMEK